MGVRISDNIPEDIIKFNNVNLAAEELAKRINGEACARLENDPVGRECDVVSDSYIAQVKPRLKTVNKSVRNQMKATFEAAKATEQAVYYQFEGVPAQLVIDKLQECSEKYGI